MEADSQKLVDANEVLVTISGDDENSKTFFDDSEGFEIFASGSYSFSKYLPQETSVTQLPVLENLTSRTPKYLPQETSVAQLPVLENLTSRTQMAPLTSSPSIEISNLSPALNKSFKVPEESTVTRRRSLARSVHSKSKSRLVEPSYPRSTKQVPTASPYRNSSHTASPANNHIDNASTAPATPKTPLLASPGGEEDDEVYKTEILESAKKEGKKMRVMILIEWIVFVCIMGFLIASLTILKLRNCMIWSLAIWKWSVLVLVIFCGRLFTEWLTNVLVFGIERNFILKKKVLYFVYSLRKSFRVFIWLGLIILAWALLINRGVKRSKNTTRILNYITRALASSLIGAAMWMVKTLLVKLLASSFHVNRFFDRIQESIFHQYVLQTLSGPPLMKNYGWTVSSKSSGHLSVKSLKKGKQVEKEEVIDVEKLHKMKREKVSAWTMGGLIKVIRNSGLSTISEALEESVDDEMLEQKQENITTEWEAKAAAYRIFNNVAKHGSKHIDEEDLLRFMRIDEVDNLLLLFEGEEEKGKIKKASFRNWVVGHLFVTELGLYLQILFQVNVYNERKFLAHSLNDTKTAIEELTKITSVIVLIIIIIVWLLLMGFATTQVLVFISSQLLLLVFMIGNACKTAFEAIIFVFVMHPFDVGDRCVIDGVQMIVEEMNILTTIFLRYDNEKISYPNSVLATKAISNFNRSPEMGDAVDFDVDVSTSAENIEALKAKIKAYLVSKPQHWRPDHSVQIKEIEEVNKMKMALYVTHTINFQNYGVKSNRRSDLVFELKKIFEELGIKYHLLPQEVHIRYTESAAPAATIVTRR